MQASRLKYCEALGLTSLNEPGRLSFLVASSRCDFRKALYYPGKVEITTRAVWVRNTSFCLSHQIYDKDQLLAAEGEDVLVLYDYSRSEKVRVSASLREQMGL